MSVLEDRAARDRQAACLRDPATVEWSHGYGAWLPVSVLTSAVLAAVLALAVLAGTRAPRWSRVLCYPASVIAVLSLFPAFLAVDDHFSFPGPDVSSISSPPCGVV